MTTSGFQTTGFYLHTHWAFNHPFAVRTWSRQDFQGMFAFLRALDFDRVMIWPITEALPPPLSDEDALYLDERRNTVADAQAAGLECWLAFAPAISTQPEIRQSPVSQRHFNRYARTFHLDRSTEALAYFTHLESILARLNNADGYVFIDGDPGGYPGARPEEYVELLHQARAILDRAGAANAPVISWLWSGWGADWVNQPPWTQDFRPLTETVLRQLKAHPPAGKWGLLPGRSYSDGWANGRINLRLVEEAGLLERSTLMAYEIVEFEPVPPAITLQFDAIRRVLYQELRHAAVLGGIFGNAQQPSMALPNLYLFARAAKDPCYLDVSDEQVLTDFAHFLDGPADLLLPAWRCLELDTSRIPADLPQRLRQARLTSAAAVNMPGGPQCYLEILAEHLQAWLTVQQACAAAPQSASVADVATRLSQAILALEGWWRVHGFVGGGDGESGFSWAYTHPRLLQPLTDWVRQYISDVRAAQPRLVNLLVDSGKFTVEEANHLVNPLLQGKILPIVPGTQPHNQFV